MTLAPLALARERLADDLDPEFGGFGSAPKFPHPTSVELLLRLWRDVLDQRVGHRGHVAARLQPLPRRVARAQRRVHRVQPRRLKVRLREGDELPGAPLRLEDRRAADAGATGSDRRAPGEWAADLWEQVQAAALAVFKRGQEIAAQGGLILVDTKYEFGLKADGTLVLIDEVHTSDSSRFWRADSYEARLAAGEEPENFDKEFVRLGYAERG